MYTFKAIKFETKLRYHIFTSILDEKEMNDDIKKIIDEQGDKQKHTTNVKAQMTDWKMSQEPGFNKLSLIFKDVCKEIAYTSHKRKYEVVIGDMWGLKYKSNDFAVTHDHWPAMWSLSYYIEPPLNCPKIIFPDTYIDNKILEITPEHGLLIVFPSYLKHYVEKKEFEGVRYVVSANAF